MKPYLSVLFVLSTGVVASLASAQPTLVEPSGSARILPIAGNGFAGSSVNVVAGLQNTLITEGSSQYAAFYVADGRLVLARRTLGSDVWITQPTSFAGEVADAHRTVSIAVDGTGYLHVAWGHHNSPLNYARGVAPGALELGPRRPMTGKLENEVTYPAFLRCPDGDLLFFYRDGGSGRGNLVLNRYDTKSGAWSAVHPNLIDGEGQRNAYASMTMDAEGVLHLAWVWRETPDVATNHDLAYARSDDGGVTWTSINGKALRIPITAATADFALRIAQNRSLMNPPSITADGDGRPFIADYWCPQGSNTPQYHLVIFDGKSWKVSQVTRRTTPFTLAGTATKHPPLSRSQVMTRTAWRHPESAYLVYRDDERGGRIVLATCADISRPSWTFADLTAESVGAWEPSLDSQQWDRLGQLQMLVQRVRQRDGDDQSGADVPATAIGSLVWSPVASDFGAGGEAALEVPAAGFLDAPIESDRVLSLMERAADWQIAHPSTYDPAGWENAPFYIGTLALAKLSASPRFHDAMLRQAEANGWAPASRLHHADDICVIQAYADLYEQHHEARMLAPSRQRLDAILADPPSTSLDWGFPGSLDRWSWCDALFMAPTSWLMVFRATEDVRYLDHMNREWWATVDALYVPHDRFFARDQSYLDLREPNGQRLYWSRGNGWVVAGLARVLDRFPKSHPDYPRYVALYRDMMDAVRAAQQTDGLWRPGLLDSRTHTARETSGSSFYTFALTWGINRGLLDRKQTEPSVRRAWHALAACVTPEGKLEHVQPIGAGPEGFDPHNTEPFGVGAFLLAGSEIYRLYGGSPDTGN